MNITEPGTASSEQMDSGLSALKQSRDVAAIRVRARELTNANRLPEAIVCLRRALELDGTDFDSRYLLALLLDDGTHRHWAESRDILLQILEEHPEIFNHRTDANLQLIRTAARRCKFVGPADKAIALSRRLAPLSGSAEDYFLLSEVLAQHGDLAEAIAALEKTIALEPASYDTDANRETLRLGRADLRGSEVASNSAARKKIGRYPQTADFLGDLHSLIEDHIASDLKHEEKFISRSTRFFTMGSCFARNVSISLSRQGYSSSHMEISEHINTTFANRVLVEMLADLAIRSANSERIRELLPPQWNAESTLALMRQSDVFVLTLGVAPAFFDRDTGEFVLPRPSVLNSRALAEKYLCRTTTVQENVVNVLHVIDFFRKLSPQSTVVISVSPVPLRASFEFESCVTADCLSKSTMRLVAHEIVNKSGLAKVIYWPSFEIFRWAGSNASDFFAADDGASWHVSEDKVNETIRSFVSLFNLDAS